MNDREYLIGAIAGWLTCPSCLRMRFSPVHGVIRALGVCPGRQRTVR